VVAGPARLKACDVATLPYPGVATDYKPLLTAMLSVATGVSVVTENLFVGRFRYVDELVRLGASITTEGHHAMIRAWTHCRDLGARHRHTRRCGVGARGTGRHG